MHANESDEVSITISVLSLLEGHLSDDQVPFITFQMI